MHAVYALAMWQLGCRGEDPATFNYWRHASALDMEDPVDAWLWSLGWARRGRRHACLSTSEVRESSTSSFPAKIQVFPSLIVRSPAYNCRYPTR